MIASRLALASLTPMASGKMDVINARERTRNSSLSADFAGLIQKSSLRRWECGMVRPIKLSEADEIRFWEKVDICGPDDCWEWTAFREKGYGRFQLNGSSYRANRIAFVVTNGDTELRVLHTCDNPPCCNPAHLFAGTQDDNNRQCRDRGRAVYVCGEKHGCAELTEDDVHAIRKLYADGWVQCEIAEEYGISQSNVSDICSGKNWKHI